MTRKKSDQNINVRDISTGEDRGEGENVIASEQEDTGNKFHDVDIKTLIDEESGDEVVVVGVESIETYPPGTSVKEIEEGKVEPLTHEVVQTIEESKENARFGGAKFIEQNGGNKSRAIRALYSEGKTVAEITKMLSPIKYQHVRGVLMQSASKSLPSREEIKNKFIVKNADVVELKAVDEDEKADVAQLKSAEGGSNKAEEAA